MVETELIISRKRIFNNKKYLIIIEQEREETGVVDPESKLLNLKQYIFKKVSEQEKILKNISLDFAEFLDEVTENKLVLGKNADKNLDTLLEKLDEFEELANDFK